MRIRENSKSGGPDHKNNDKGDLVAEDGCILIRTHRLHLSNALLAFFSNQVEMRERLSA